MNSRGDELTNLSGRNRGGRNHGISRAVWHRWMAALVLGWLVAAVAVSLVHRELGSAHWLLVHLLLLGAVTNAIVVWSTHFTTALLRLPEPSPRLQWSRLVLLNSGVLAVVFGVVGDVTVGLTAGAVAVAVAISWHGIDLTRRLRSALPSRFLITVRYYQIAAVMLLVAVGLGTLLARGAVSVGTVSIDPSQLVLAHAQAALLGWVGLSITGTLVTFWPTILRTRIDERATRAARRALVLLTVGAVAGVVATLVSVMPVAALGSGCYLAGLIVLAGPFVRVTLTRPPSDFATWSVLAGVVWFVVAVAGLGIAQAVPGTAVQVAERAGTLTAVALVGCIAQTLLGSLSYLLPAMTGGGPQAVRWRQRVVNRGAVARVVSFNLALAVCVLPTPSLVRVTTSILVLIVLVWSLPLLVRCLMNPPTDQGHPAEKITAPTGVSNAPVSNQAVSKQQWTGSAVLVGLSTVVLAIVVGVAGDPAALGSATSSAASTTAGVVATGQTTVVEVTMQGMRFLPDRIEVPAGNTLVINVVNRGDDVHDLTLETGQHTARLQPGESATLDVGVVRRDIAGWCAIAGHRQMGMVLNIVTTGDSTPATDGHSAHDHSGSAPVATHSGETGGDTSSSDLPNIDVMATPGPTVSPYDAVLPPLGKRTTHRVRLAVTETEQEVAPGIRQTRWTFGGTAPGPVLHGRVGDRFIVTLVNDGTIGHSIDFHAGALAPDQPMRTIAPGEQLTYRFTATRAGIWMYHCSTMPMSMHIANGMFGAVVIEPPNLPPVDRQFVLVQSEAYLGAQGATADAQKISQGQADLVVFNGYPMQYGHWPLTARVGDRVRFWVLDAGPNRASSFHVVGGQFDRVWFEGAYLLRGRNAGGSQALAMQPAQGGFVEMRILEVGTYPFVTHIMSDAEKGAHGLLRATQ